MLDFWLTGFNLSNELLFLFIYFFSSSVFSFVYLWALVVAWPPGQGPASKEHWAWFPWCRVPALSETEESMSCLAMEGRYQSQPALLRP